MTPKEIKDFSKTFLHLWDQLRMPDDGDSRRKFSQEIAVKYHIIYTSRELEGMLPSEEKPSIDFNNAYVWLRPLERDCCPIPVVTLRCGFQKSPPDLSVRFALFFRNKQGLCAIGFRLETPDGQEGVHSFCHAQMMRSFQKDPPYLPGCPEWIPESQPAFPLDATCPFSLLISLMVSLYGKDEVGKALSSLGEAVVPLKKIRDSMHLFHSDVRN